MRVKARGEHNKVALTVIYFLGAVAIVGVLGSYWLVHDALASENEIDSAAVALIGQFVSITTLALGALGAMLSSTSPKPPPPPEVQPVNVVNPPSEPVPTEPVEGDGS